MKIPIVSELLGGKKEITQSNKEPDPVRVAGSIPTIQPGQLPTYDVIKEAAKTNSVDDDWKKKYRGFDLLNAAPFGNIVSGEEQRIRSEFEIQQEIFAQFTPVDSVFDEDFADRRLEVIQDPVLVEQQYSKGINSNLLNRALGSYTNNKTEIQAGGIQKPAETKGGLRSFLLR